MKHVGQVGMCNKNACHRLGIMSEFLKDPKIKFGRVSGSKKKSIVVCEASINNENFSNRYSDIFETPRFPDLKNELKDCCETLGS